MPGIEIQKPGKSRTCRQETQPSAEDTGFQEITSQGDRLQEKWGQAFRRAHG